MESKPDNTVIDDLLSRKQYYKIRLCFKGRSNLTGHTWPVILAPPGAKIW